VLKKALSWERGALAFCEADGSQKKKRGKELCLMRKQINISPEFLRSQKVLLGSRK
jgi:hypothetical protein